MWGKGIAKKNERGLRGQLFHIVVLAMVTGQKTFVRNH